MASICTVSSNCLGAINCQIDMSGGLVHWHNDISLCWYGGLHSQRSVQTVMKKTTKPVKQYSDAELHDFLLASSDPELVKLANSVPGATLVLDFMFDAMQAIATANLKLPAGVSYELVITSKSKRSEKNIALAQYMLDAAQLAADNAFAEEKSKKRA